MTLFAILIAALIFLVILSLAWKELGLAEFISDFLSGLWNMMLSLFIRIFRIPRG